ncbi:hypothetical protein RvY_18483 [Ramazzottius varieornatus]|uniref:Uncharacterized protein n=1 Tax=Ramazzottius varieornatus TaxID=947166 RepID=A0A1D1W5Z3_RAMVA|nr:hypothetical protein RvY_18483 [Ramazzottius varieornatus]
MQNEDFDFEEDYFVEEDSLWLAFDCAMAGLTPYGMYGLYPGNFLPRPEDRRRSGSPDDSSSSEEGYRHRRRSNFTYEDTL